jgi:hypothetical protein
MKKIKTRQVYCVWTVTFINDECEISNSDKEFMFRYYAR